MINDSFFTIIFLGFILSFILIFLAFLRYKTLTFFDLFVIFGWFHVFFRPLFIDTCTVQKYLYYWDEEGYVNGVTIGILLLLTLQISSLFYKPQIIKAPSPSFVAKIEQYTKTAFLFSLVVTIVMFLLYGTRVFNRGAGALSVSLPGLEYFFYILTPILTVLITSVVFQLLTLKTNTKKNILYLIFAITILLVFGKRGKMIGPFITSAILYFYYYKNINRKGILKAINIKIVFTFIFILFIAFFGKVIKLNPSSPSFSSQTKNSSLVDACALIKKGGQEFDVLWPAVIKLSVESMQIQDLPSAIIASLIYPHNIRLDQDRLSITDKLMLEHNYDAYRFLKFGISPNTFQFYYTYLVSFTFPFFIFFGYFLRRLDYRIIKYYFSGKVIQFLLLLLVSGLIKSPFDFTIKYFIFQFFVIIAFYQVNKLGSGNQRK